MMQRVFDLFEVVLLVGAAAYSAGTALRYQRLSMVRPLRGRACSGICCVMCILRMPVGR